MNLPIQGPLPIRPSVTPRAGRPVRASRRFCPVSGVQPRGHLLEKRGDLAGARAEYAGISRSDPDFRPEKDTLRN